MPIYEFECGHCGEKFELLLGVRHDPKEIRCPKCRATKARRLMSTFSSAGGSHVPSCGCASGGST